MSIHQSKGTEFPVVALADLNKAFRHDNSQILLDEHYGLCPQIKPPHADQRYPSPVYWLARHRQRREMLGEEIRLLYVALTRACDTLLLAGTLTSKQAEQWEQPASGPVSVQKILEGRSYLDWLGAWLPRSVGASSWSVPGEAMNGPWRWVLYEDSDPRLEPPAAEPSPPAGPLDEPSSEESEHCRRLKQRLGWDYSFESATVEPAKSSVSLLRKRRVEWDEESQQAPFLQGSRIQISTAKDNRLGAAEIGIAHHLFLQYVALERTGNPEALQGEADRLRREQLLTEAQTAALDLQALAGFWQSDLGRWIVSCSNQVHRELPFTVRFDADELAELDLKPAAQGQGLAGEYVVVQGVIDLAVITPEEMTVVDFKTDELQASQVEEKNALYRPQLRLYSRAISDIYQRPVTGLWLHYLALNRSVPLLRG
jgi:ATP-dependent helicase/nuclease subunit A